MDNKFQILESGFVLVDKPQGPSSHEVTSYVKKIFGAKNAGHAGTLDPQVSGVLVIGLNKATRLLRFVTSKEKTYVGVMRLGKAPKNILQLQKEMDKFVGKISQMPPRESAVAKRKREREVFEFKCLELEGKKALFLAKVEAGTYARVLCEQVGKSFGKGKMIELRRIGVGKINEEKLVSLSDLKDGAWQASQNGDEKAIRRYINPATQMIELPILRLENQALDTACRGAPLALSGVASVEANFKDGQMIQLLDARGNLAAIAKLENGKIFPKIVIRE